MARINLDLKCLPLPEKFARARQDAKTKTTDQNNKEEVVDRLLTQLAAYVASVSGDNRRMIQSTVSVRCRAATIKFSPAFNYYA